MGRDDEQQRDVAAETAEAGEGRWDQGSGQVASGGTTSGAEDADSGAADAPAVYDPGRVGLEDGDDRNPSDPAAYPDPADQRHETSRAEPGLDTDG